MAMSKEHKEALARGRKEARAVKAYLKAIDERTSGRQPSKGTLQNRLDKVNQKIEATQDPLKTVDLLQSKLDIEKTLSRVGDQDDFEETQKAFVENVRPYSERKGITYTAWREFGVPAKVLRAAGLPETRRR
ncbi:MAG: hypothetical protein ACRDVL_06130 [Acidimicrobiia bacterium]